MEKGTSFTEGKILKPLILFALPVLFALFLQAMYGAVDLMIVGKFASSADVSAVSTGSQIMMTLTSLVSSFAMGTTILLGQQIGCGERKEGGKTVGTAIATVFAQVVSVVVSFVVICKKKLPFELKRSDVRIHGRLLRKMAGLGAPIALQDLLVSISFLIILAIVNSMGVTASAGVGVSFAIGVFMFSLSFFHGDVLAGIFSSDASVIAAVADYLRSYAIDCMLTAIFFCYIGFYNGIGRTKFVMMQGIIGAFGVRVPVSYLMSRRANASLFDIGLATPCSSAVQILLCVGFMLYLKKKDEV